MPVAKKQRNTYDNPSDTSDLIVTDELAEQPFREVEQDKNSISTLLKTAGLSEHEVEMVKMHYIDGIPQKQIADELGTKIGTVKSRLNRGLGKLRHYATKRGITRASLDLFD